VTGLRGEELRYGLPGAHQRYGLLATNSVLLGSALADCLLGSVKDSPPLDSRPGSACSVVWLHFPFPVFQGKSSAVFRQSLACFMSGAERTPIFLRIMSS